MIKILIGYKELYGEEKNLEDLIEIIEKYSLIHLLSYLSRIQSAVAGDRISIESHIHEVVRGVIAKSVVEKLESWIIDRGHNKEDVFLVSHRQVATLQQLAIVHSKEIETELIASESFFLDFTNALLITSDLLEAKTEDLSDLYIQLFYRNSSVPFWIYFGRAFKLYGLDGSRTDKLNDYFKLFYDATNVNAEDAILGGLCIALQESNKGSVERESGWHSVVKSEERHGTEKRCVEAFEKIALGKSSAIVDDIQRFEKGLSVEEYNLITMSKFPLIEMSDNNYYVINLSYLGRCLTDGVYHTVLSYALKTEKSAARVNGIYGEIFEFYVEKLLKECFEARLIKIPDSLGFADYLVVYENRVLVLEVKHGRLNEISLYKCKSVDERKKDLRKASIYKAGGQLRKTVAELRTNDDLRTLLPFKYDWTVTPIVPLIVTELPYPQDRLVYDELYGDVAESLAQLKDGRGIMEKLGLLSVQDVETLLSLKDRFNVGELANKWRNDKECWDGSFYDYLISKEISGLDNYMKQVSYEGFVHLGKKLGIDTNRLHKPNLE